MTCTVISTPATTYTKEPLPLGSIRVSTHSDLAFVTPSIISGQFAFARVNGEVSLVRASSMTPTSLTVEVFTHEFISIFRLFQSLTIPLASPGLRILEILEEGAVLYEEENETCFLAKDVLERLRKVKESSAAFRRSSKGQHYPRFNRILTPSSSPSSTPSSVLSLPERRRA